MSDVGPFHGLSTTLDLRRTNVERIEDMGSGVFDSSFFIPITDVGELVVQLAFGPAFIEKPLFTSGGELGPSQPTLSGLFPTISMIVRNWNILHQLGNNNRVYVGCTLLVVTTGSDGQAMIGHAQFVGQAIWSPS